MRRLLIVGCGGSGGSTLCYLMDQLRSMLGRELPRAWQFVFVDVPTVEQAGPDGLKNVQEQGGTYLATGEKGGNYATLDRTVSNSFAGKSMLGSIGTWAPREPVDVAVGIQAGAGQYRAVGRMITLCKASKIRDGLAAAVKNLTHPDAVAELRQLAEERKEEYVGGDPLVLVISSMAGGAGASMALDVCRILSVTDGISPRLMGVFAFTADVFNTLPLAARTGVRANALAMLGEVVSMQAGAAVDHDSETFAALGVAAGSGEVVKLPFARIFPVGSTVGDEGAVFGDGSPKALYRGLARGLAGLVSSPSATEAFVNYDLVNTGSPPGDRSILGWGVNWDDVPWGAFGFASLSMGRDRYAEYAAQRLARTAADRLREGHLQRGNPASGTEQIRVLYDSQRQRVHNGVGLPTLACDPRATLEWLKAAYGEQALKSSILRVVDDPQDQWLTQGGDVQASQWAQGVSDQLARRRHRFTSAADEIAYRSAYEWHSTLMDRTLLVVSDAVARFGLPYAAFVVDDLKETVERTATSLNNLSQVAQEDVGALPKEVGTIVAAAKGKFAGTDALRTKVLDNLNRALFKNTCLLLAGRARDLLYAFTNEVLGPLSKALRDGLTLLENERDKVVGPGGLADLATNEYSRWPSDTDQAVAARWSHAVNEVLLTPSRDFQDRYSADLAESLMGDPEVSSRPDPAMASHLAAARVILGRWQTTGGALSPGGLVSTLRPWVPGALPHEPDTGVPRTKSVAEFRFGVSPAELLSRARQYVARPEESFDRFCSLSLRNYARGTDASEAVRDQMVEARQRELVSKFRETLEMAKPLVRVDAESVMAVHGQSVLYRYKFSQAPFAGLPLSGELHDVLRMENIDASTLGFLESAMNSSSTVTNIDVFGSYQNYSPVVFSGLMKPVAEQWSEISDMGRQSFWQWRRTRPLAAALPMGSEERRAMVAGWFVGVITGQITHPAKGKPEPVKIWDPKNSTWVSFPFPLLTPRSQFKAEYDLLPAVLESILVAMARVQVPPAMSSLRPYRLLRELYDMTPFEPHGAVDEPSALEALAAWVHGVPTPAPSPTEPADDALPEELPEKRVERAKALLAAHQKLAGVHFMAPGQYGAPGGGTFSAITDRGTASSTPIYRDLAPDIYWAGTELTNLLDQALKSSPTVGGSAGGVGAAKADVEMPDLDVF